MPPQKRRKRRDEKYERDRKREDVSQCGHAVPLITEAAVAEPEGTLLGHIPGGWKGAGRGGVIAHGGPRRGRGLLHMGGARREGGFALWGPG